MAASALGCTPADLAAVEEIVRKAGTSFARGMRVLPPDRRYAMYAIYAFCRLVDDVADEESPLADRLPRLDQWRDRIAGLYAGRTQDALDRVLHAAINRYALRQADFDAVIDGMQTDAETVVVAPGPAEYDLYCDRVASAVGRLSVRAFGDGSADADRVAHHLGRALQTTNILRDLGEDAERGRLYLPADVLDAHGVPHEPDAALRSPGLRPACRDMADRAEAHFREARAAMRRCDRRAMRPARLMAASYAAILDTLRKADWREPRIRVSVPLWRKLRIAARAAIPL
ncbi:presqualene diphosphate synthase HpnD [Acetobacteraceae bacterium KSS8]|uniref:Presqualene diphosphate synthase HpnD n=1 Tax=Endosaccharibacter trunci TaxID=2812733 RepID=A0ABT1WAR5_9PROT|nr:presqualene diphosphate synthase HpnD [Acetobacteraceae bacterium KSS8]